MTEMPDEEYVRLQTRLKGWKKYRIQVWCHSPLGGGYWEDWKYFFTRESAVKWANRFVIKRKLKEWKEWS